MTRDFIDELTDYAEKMRQEYSYAADDDALAHMIRFRARLRAFRIEAAETEQERFALSEALRPFLPERPPVALQSDPGAIPEDILEDMPNVVRGWR